MTEIELLEAQLEKIVLDNMQFDAAHDILHIKRVVKLAKTICSHENADPMVVVPAAWLHDCVNVAKDSPDRNKGSLLSANTAVKVLRNIGYPNHLLDNIHHTIHAHSFSANVEAKTIEAKVLQDADRLDAIGAHGIARCLRYGAVKGAEIYHPTDPLATSRELNEQKYSIDHFYTKLFKLEHSMQTSFGSFLATERTNIMRTFVADLLGEI